MSKRNSQAAKQAARERLRAEREKQARKDKVRRQMIVGVSVVAAIAAIGGVSFAIIQANKPGEWENALDAKLTAPANTTGKNGTTVVIGKDSAKNTLKLYEDSRCPICAQFEQGVGEEIEKDVESGKFKLQYVGATFLDGDSMDENKVGSHGEGSKNALSALGAALDVSPEAFLDFKAALYSQKFHPEETDDKFKSDDYLIEVADSVPALKGDKGFAQALEKGTYDRWALEMSKTFATNKDDVTGTPTLVLNGKKLTVGQGNPPMTPEQYRSVVDGALKKN